MKFGFDGRVLQDHFPGIGRYLDRLIRALAVAHPNDSFHLFVDESLPNRRFDFGDYRKLGISVRPMRGGLFSPFGQIAAAKTIDRAGLDLMVASYFLTPLGLRTPLVVTIHDVIPLRYPRSLPGTVARLSYRPLLQRVLSQARRVIVDSRWVIRELAEFGMTVQRVSAIPLAADPPTTVCEVDPDPALPVPPPFFLYVGIDKPLKNLPFLIRAYAASGVAWPLVLAGPRDSRFTQTENAIASLGYGNRVVRTGPVDNVTLSGLYRSATAFVFPSLAEGFGLPPLEAMAAGVPVICSNAASLPEVCGEAAITLAPTSERDWSNAMRQVAGDRQLRERLAAAGRIQAAQFSWEKTAEATYRVLRSALGDRS